MLQKIKSIASRLIEHIDIDGRHARRRRLRQRAHFAMLATTEHRLVRARLHQRG